MEINRETPEDAMSEQTDPITGLPYFVDETTGEWTPAYSGKAEMEYQAEMERKSEESAWITEHPHYVVGQRVEIHPAKDAWMQGDRYGVIEKIGRKYLHVRMDRSGRLLPIAPIHIYEVLS